MFNTRMRPKSVSTTFILLTILFLTVFNGQISAIETDSIETVQVSPRLERNRQFGDIVQSGKTSAVKTNAPSADGDVDMNFNSSVTEGTGYVEDTIVQPDGKIIVGGSFSGVNGETHGYLVRLNADGSLDTAFNPGGAGPGGAVLALARQPDGKILIGNNGGFYNNTFSGSVTRLNSDGTLDASFNGGTNANSTVESIVVQPDGKILIGGFFTFYNHTARSRIARLNADGSLDTTFEVGSGANNPVFTIVLQSDGRILIGGIFSAYNGANARGVARLNPNGSLDATFNTGGSGANSSVETIVLQPDGRILIGGNFTTFNGTATPLGLVRLNPFGAIETVFNLPGLTASITAVALLPNGAFLAAGSFNNGSEISRGVASFNFPLGTSFGASQANADILSLVVLPDGKLLAGGNFTQYNGEVHRRLVRLNANGSVDNGFVANINTVGIVYRVAPQTGGKIVIGGDFELINGVGRSHLARLNADGSLDTTFNVGSGANAPIFALATQTDGKIIIGGIFTAYNGTARNRIARINTDGSLDTTFNPAPTPAAIYNLSIQTNGKILVCGASASAQLGGASSIIRLNADGSTDSTFNTAGTTGTIRAVELLPDGKILVGGVVGIPVSTSPGTIAVSLVLTARLNQNGSVDSTFSNSIAGGQVENIALLPDGKYLIGGTLNDANNQFRGLVRLFPNGSIDQSFDASGTVNGTVRALLVQPDGKILIGGFFVNSIARLNSDGSRDAGFNAAADSFVDDIAVQADGKILLGGEFTLFNNVPRLGLVRLQGAPLTVTRHILFDYDGDGKADVSVYRPSSGVWYLLNSGTNNSFSATQFGISTDKITPADYDGDGKADVAVYRDGNWYLLRSSAGFAAGQFGLSSDIAVPADYDGDGRADLAVYRPANGTWYVLNLANNQFSAVQFGVAEDKPVVGDYDGDGKSDYAVYRPSSGVWYLLQSSKGFAAVQFGVATDKAVPADYDGDGKTDEAVYRPESGTWYLLQSGKGFAAVQFGVATDLAAPADYDGDGKADVAVFRPSNGTWYQMKSTLDFAAIQFGSNGDKPTPNAFVP